MGFSAFDPSGAVRFDLRSGAAHDARGERLVLVPSAALASLDAATLAKVGGEIGRACGERVASRLGGSAGVRSAQPELVIGHLAGELAVAGIAALHVERWGKALVAVVENASVASSAFVGAVLAGALGAATGQAFAAAALGDDGANGERYLLGSPSAAERAREMVGRGQRYADVLAALHGGAS